ncbi:prenyltransferase/squalene oxidase repeat-containing protein [Streptomyces sp. NPDC059649]|uniref:prenyltransferase/squalene oxidase repeat-containing protein n=1 Tax=Streptomyces sp. NPDC059649 TaxID=3346895 RepID=UPI00369C24BD
MAPMASMAHQAPSTHPVAFLARRAATALAAAAVLGAAAAPAAFADAAPAAPSGSPQKLPAGLYGTKDPQYDGVWRQSLALLAQHTVGVRPAAAAVDWLVGQQCADGSYTAFRADPGKACDAKTMRDTNQTAAAVQALAALGGHGKSVTKAVDWLKSVQNDDGGWSSMSGSPSDANSTSVVIGALAAAGRKPESVTSKKGGKTPYDGLLTFRLGCDTKEEGRGAFTFQLKGAAPNADATAAAATGALGKGFVVSPEAGAADAPVKSLTCKGGAEDGAGKGKQAGAAADRARAADGGAAYLVDQLGKNGQHLLSAMPGAEKQPDVGNTADAVVALAAGGHRSAAQRPLAWLEKNAAGWARQNGPAAYAQLVLAAHATGTDPRAFGGTDLVSALNATGPKPATVSTKAETSGKDEQSDEGKGGGLGVVWVVAVGLAIGAGIGFLLSGRKNRTKNDL